MPIGFDRVASKLTEIEKTEGKLPPLLDFYQGLLAIQDRVMRRIKGQGSVLTPAEIRTRTAEGRPLVGDDETAVEMPLARQAFKEVVALFLSHRELFGVLPEAIQALPPGRIINSRTVRAWYRGRHIVLPVPVDGVDRPLLNSIFHGVLKPFLAVQAASLAGAFDQETWRRGYCPVCGGNPDFAYLAKETGARWLVCSRCDMEWLYQRIGCPYCGNTDQNKLNFLTDEKSLYRLYLCEECKRYLKAIDLRQAPADTLVTLERVLTGDMDRQAQEKGYLPCD